MALTAQPNLPSLKYDNAFNQEKALVGCRSFLHDCEIFAKVRLKLYIVSVLNFCKKYELAATGHHKPHFIRCCAGGGAEENFYCLSDCDAGAGDGAR